MKIGVLAALLAICFTAWSLTTWSLTAWGQVPWQPNTTLPDHRTYRPRGRIPEASEILKNVHGSYAVSYMGPRINGTPEETYNIYLSDVSSVQLFHSVQLGYQVNDQLQLGFGEDVSQNLVEGVVGLNGSVSQRSLIWFDPYVYFLFPGLFRIQGWSISNSATFSLPVGQASLDAGRISSLTFRQSWSKESIAPWRFSLQMFLNPQIYAQPKPAGFNDRQTFYGAMGPNIGYEITNEFTLGVQTNFTVEHRSPNPNGWGALGESISDTLKTSLTWAPQSHPVYASVSTYFQSILWSPSFDTSIVGASLSLGF